VRCSRRLLRFTRLLAERLLVIPAGHERYVYGLYSGDPHALAAIPFAHRLENKVCRFVAIKPALR
jgi:hypothetical protein